MYAGGLLLKCEREIVNSDLQPVYPSFPDTVFLALLPTRETWKKRQGSQVGYQVLA